MKPGTDPILLRVAQLGKTFANGNRPVVDRVGFEVGRNEIFAILGPSGCGKTTTLRLIAGFERCDTGTVSIGERVLECATEHQPAEGRGIGFVFQDYALFPHLDVAGNIAFGLKGLSRAETAARVRATAEATGLADLLDRKPHQLSGGQQQRVALARAMAPQPALILLDEPFSNLDAVLRERTRDEVRALLKAAGMSAILVTHDQEEALSFADRIAVMRDGRIEQVGTPEEVYETPRTEFVATFLGRTNLVKGRARGMQAWTDLGSVLIDRPMAGDVVLSMRPEHLALERMDETNCNGLCGTVLERSFKGHDVTYRVALTRGDCLIHTHNRDAYAPGDRVVVKALEPAVVLETEAALA